MDAETVVRKRVPDEEFIVACHQCNSIDEISEKTGLAKSTVQQRRNRLNKLFPTLLKKLPHGPRKTNNDDVVLATFAKLYGEPVEILRQRVENARQA